MPLLPKDILAYNAAQSAADKKICDTLAEYLNTRFGQLAIIQHMG